MNDKLDHRLNAYRPDLADVRLKGRVDAGAYAVGDRRAHRRAGRGPEVRSRPRCRNPDAGPDGRGGHRLRTGRRLVLGPGEGRLAMSAMWRRRPAGAPKAEPTHRVVVPRTFLYPGADLRFPPVAALSAGSLHRSGRPGRDARRALRRPGGRNRRHRATLPADRRGLLDGLRLGRRELHGDALSVGRALRLRHRLLRARPAGAATGGLLGAARFRHAGGGPRPGASSRARTSPACVAETSCSGRATSACCRIRQRSCTPAATP